MQTFRSLNRNSPDLADLLKKEAIIIHPQCDVH